MPIRDNPKPPDTPSGTQGASKDAPAPSDASPGGGAKAQAELQRYKARMAGMGPSAAYGAAGAPGIYMVPVAGPHAGAPMPGWALPPSLAALSPFGMGDSAAGGAQAGAAAAGSLLGQLGSTLRL